MKIRDTIKLAFKNAVRGKSKTFLCAVAVCVGVSSIYIMGAVSSNAKIQIDNAIEKAGMGGIMVFESGENAHGISADEIRQLPSVIDEISAAMPVFVEYGDYKLRNTRGNMVMWGIDEQFEDIFSVDVLYGRLPSQDDVRGHAKVAVVEDTMAQAAYGRVNIVGKKIMLSGDGPDTMHTIIGVITSQKSGVNAIIGGDKLPSFVYAPYTSVQSSSGSTTSQLAVACGAGVSPDDAIKKTIRRLEATQNGARFNAENISGYVDQFSSITAIVSLVLTLLGSITLFVGGIGVMNSMISAVDSRKKEIGIYLAIGAQKHDIVLCYLFEAVFICLAGGIVGAISGAIILKTVTSLVGITLELSLGFLAVTLLSACVCGMLFGILPAIKAAGMKPIAAIREE